MGLQVRLEDGSYVSPCTLLVVPGQVKASLLEVEPFKATLATYIYDLAKEATRAAEDLQRALMATSSALPVGRPFEGRTLFGSHLHAIMTCVLLEGTA